MQTTFKPEDIDRLLAEADALIEGICSGAIQDLEEGERLRVELQAQRLAELKAQIKEKAAAGGAPESGSYGEGMHEAIMDIMAAVKNLGRDLS